MPVSERIKSSRRRMPNDEVALLESSIHDFLEWLESVERIPALTTYHNALIAEPTEADWIMQVDRPGRPEAVVRFNPHILGRCSFDYYRMVVIHECFHLLVQDVPNKIDAKRLKDDFGDEFMKLLDIEADFYAAKFLIDKMGKSLTDVFSLYFEGSTIFGDPKIRHTKLERFIGTILSVSNYCFEREAKRDARPRRELYLPTVSAVAIEEKLDVLVVCENRFVLKQIQADINDLIMITKAYVGVDELSKTEYVDRLLCFSSKALGCRTTRHSSPGTGP